MHDALVVSDVHLGSDLCKVEKFQNFLKLIEKGTLATKELIINGDLLDSLDFRRLSSAEWNILSTLTAFNKHMKVVWNPGNHDSVRGSLGNLLALTNPKHGRVYLTHSGGKSIVFVHGDVYDSFITTYPVVTSVADTIYRWTHKFDSTGQFSNWLKHSSKTFARCEKRIEDQALNYASMIRADYICCGHTHTAKELKTDTVTYYNSGCWTQDHCTYLKIVDGKITIEAF